MQQTLDFVSETKEFSVPPDINDGTNKVIEYLMLVRKAILEIRSFAKNDIIKLAEVLKFARDLNREVKIVGTGHDYCITNHAHVDWLKTINLRVVDIGVPTFTAFGNDYPHATQIKEILKLRSFGNKDVLVGLQFEGNNLLLDEAFKFNYEHDGINILISNNRAVNHNIHHHICIETDNVHVARDISQIILHFLGIHIANEKDAGAIDEGARDFSSYCDLLLESLNDDCYSCSNLSRISALIKNKLSNGHSLYAFGNGGSAALSTYLIEGLREMYINSPHIYRNLFDLTSFLGEVTGSISKGYYKKDIYTNLIENLGVKNGDVLFGISSSGNSENIIHPFTKIHKAFRIGLLGFDEGGIIGNKPIKDMAFIVPDRGSYKSYQRAEDGQRIAISAILNTFTLEEQAQNV